MSKRIQILHYDESEHWMKKGRTGLSGKLKSYIFLKDQDYAIYFRNYAKAAVKISTN